MRLFAKISSARLVSGLRQRCALFWFRKCSAFCGQRCRHAIHPSHCAWNVTASVTVIFLARQTLEQMPHAVQLLFTIYFFALFAGRKRLPSITEATLMRGFAPVRERLRFATSAAIFSVFASIFFSGSFLICLLIYLDAPSSLGKSRVGGFNVTNQSLVQDGSRGLY